MVFALMPLIPGAFRLVELGGGPHLMPANPRIAAFPLPVIIHIVSAFFYSVVGAWQFSPALRRVPWHRWAGRLLAPLGIGAALSGVYMTLFYPAAPNTHELLMVFRLLFGGGMAIAIALGVWAIIVDRDVATHRAWMMRAYALGLGAASQMVIFLSLAPLGTPNGFVNALMMGAAWAINLGIAEWIIRRPMRVRLAPASA
jgi:hypothetical protein